MNNKTLLLIAILAFISCNKIAAQANASDSLALVDLYNHSNGPGWKRHANWLTKKPLSEWYGVTMEDSRVVSLTLSRNQLNGRLPSSIGNLTALTNLDLYGNILKASIPVTIGNLVNLTSLTLTFNSFKNNIPASLGKLTKLTYLSVNSNNLSGAIPPSLGNLTQLTELYLGNNKLTGSIPDALGKLTNLVTLDLNLNQLSGELPKSIFNLTKVTDFGINNNQFSGSIPPAIEKLTGVVALRLQDNQFSGTIPATIAHLPNLTGLYLSNNQLSGSIPEALSKSATLNTIEAENNQLTGSIPAALWKTPSLISLRVSNNQLSGELPMELITKAHLAVIAASHNQLTFSKNYDAGAGSTTLSGLYVDDNRFTFDGLEFVAKNVPVNDYAPQAAIAIHRHGNSLSVTAGGTLSNNLYKWFKAGITTAVAVNRGDSVFTPTEDGQYFATVNNNIARRLTLQTDTFNFTINPVTAAATPLAITVSPNPVANRLQISGLNDKTNCTITITDLRGYVLQSLTSAKQRSIQCTVSRLPAGSYLVTVKEGNTMKSVQFKKE